MGIKINELVKEVSRTITFENLLNKKIAIDAFNTMYQFLAIIRQKDGTPLKDYEGNVTSQLSGLFYRTINFIEHKIKPIYVFDGTPSDLKFDVIKVRKQVKQEAEEKMVQAQDDEDFAEARKFAQMTSKLDSNMIEESKKLLEFLGVPILVASSEGEAQSAYLVNVEEAWACASQDYDTLLFGGERLIRKFAVSRSRKVKDTTVALDIEFISLSKLLGNLKITREQLVDMGVLIGTDFFEGIKGIGQHIGLELIKKYGSLENIVKEKAKVGGREIKLDFDVVNQLRNIFLNPDVRKEYPKLILGKIKYEKVEELMIEQHNFSKQRIENALERLKKLDSAKTQVSLDSFFKKS